MLRNRLELTVDFADSEAAAGGTTWSPSGRPRDAPREHMWVPHRDVPPDGLDGDDAIPAEVSGRGVVNRGYPVSPGAWGTIRPRGGGRPCPPATPPLGRRSSIRRTFSAPLTRCCAHRIEVGAVSNSKERSWRDEGRRWTLFILGVAVNFPGEEK